MYFKNIILCLLVFSGTIHSMEVSEETKQHMQACYDAIKNNQVKKLHELLAEHKFFNQYVIIAHNDACQRFYSNYSHTYFCRCHFNDPLQVAIHEAKVPCIQLIADLRGKIHQKYSNTTFYHPCYLLDLYKHRKKYTEEELMSLTRLFLDNKIAKVDEYYTQTIPGATPLHKAPTASIAEYLIQRGASVDSMVIPQGIATPLICFAESESPRKTAILLCLLKYNAKVDLQNQNGEASFHWAASHGCLHHVKLLLDYGADITKKTKMGNAQTDRATSRAQACIKNYPRIALIAKNFDIDPFKYTDHFDPSKYICANTTNILRNRELTGKKHHYRGYKVKQSDTVCPTSV